MSERPPRPIPAESVDTDIPAAKDATPKVRRRRSGGPKLVVDTTAEAPEATVSGASSDSAESLPDTSTVAPTEEPSVSEEPEEDFLKKLEEATHVAVENEKTKIYDNPEEDPAVQDVEMRAKEMASERVEAAQAKGKEEVDSPDFVFKVYHQAEFEAWNVFASQYPEKAAAYEDKVGALQRALKRMGRSKGKLAATPEVVITPVPAVEPKRTSRKRRAEAAVPKEGDTEIDIPVPVFPEAVAEPAPVAEPVLAEPTEPTEPVETPLPAEAIDENSRQQAEQTIEAIPEKEKRQFYRGFLGLGYTARGLKSEALAWAFGKLEKKFDVDAVEEGKKLTGVSRFAEDTDEARDKRRAAVIEQQDGFLARLVRGSTTKYRQNADEALHNLDKIYAQGEKSQAVKGVMSSAQFATLVGQVAFRGASKTFNPFRTVGASLLALGAGVEIAKEARINSLERMERGRLECEEAFDEAEQIAEKLRAERGGEKFTSNEYQQQYLKQLPQELLQRLEKSDVSRLGWASQKAHADIKKTLEKINARVESAPQGKKKRLQQFLTKGFQERYLRDVERLLERDGTIDVVAYGLKKAEKYTKAGAALATAEALAGAFFDYDTTTQDFGDAIDKADPAHPETLGAGDSSAHAGGGAYGGGGVSTDYTHIEGKNLVTPEGAPVSTGVEAAAEKAATVLEIGKKGPEGSIINYFAEHKDAATKFGWDGKEDLKTWAGKKAHMLWNTHAAEALKTDSVKESLTKLGYTNDLDGYTKMMTRIKTGGVSIDLQNKGITLSNMEYLKARVPDAPSSTMDTSDLDDMVGLKEFLETHQSASEIRSDLGETIEVGSRAGDNIDTSHDAVEGEPPHEESLRNEEWRTRRPSAEEIGEPTPEESPRNEAWRERRPDTSLKFETLDTSSMSVSEAVSAQMDHDLTKVFGTEDDTVSEWHQWRAYGTRRFLNLHVDPDHGRAAYLQSYIRDLEARSGLRPRGGIFLPNEKIQDYISRALKAIEESKRKGT